jgi:hypothetical protein
MTSVKRAITPLDAAITAVFLVLGVVYMAAVVDDEGGSWAAVPLFALVPVMLLWRRQAPLAALAGLVAAVGIHIVLFGTLTRCGVFLAVDLLLVFAAGARLPWRLSVLGLALALGGAVLMLGFDASAPLDEAGVFAAVLVSGVWAVGAALHAVAVRTAETGAVPVPARS